MSIAVENYKTYFTLLYFEHAYISHLLVSHLYSLDLLYLPIYLMKLVHSYLIIRTIYLKKMSTKC